MATRLVAGALLGAGVWPLLSAGLPFLPLPGRFLIAWLLFTFGPGIGLAGALTRELDPLRRLIVVLGVGSAATPVLIDVLGRVDLVPAFPYLAAALAGSGLAWWTGRAGRRAASTPWADVAVVLGSGRAGGGTWRHRVLASIGSLVGWRRAVRRLRHGGSGLLRRRGVGSRAHGPADGVVLLRPSSQRRLLPASGPRIDSSLRGGAGAADLLPLRLADVSGTDGVDQLLRSFDR